ncbi:SDR family NAD(P)-dependent oxidoreductase [Flammeovirga yaeyamensis]|uniref:SDR family NAD(P)-dependent oxidoreductase n=1 Tax=Flammeovirga yaeyamensis TaxID=367791 RepID=A0AAX1N4S0_9BACT|nr:SDR family NAD(P)-dependent oxidoreductase [Flammeovirga yaeyamensis]MBB3698476.1 NADP-dependent 3-hydroxy acid dehydrogenase YdfG [Flammeovirga yaeyamensis]NMF34175.1 SDR family NAD(P)-dependent oxidoreductase [Flammeovirga yaeyamensis]QWG01160.1 SDR family NAD(P)-dependent oxidoreductase [Flammeovirga yaeyamensis]
MKKTALITGATSGIGKATAELFADNGIRLIICGRRADRLETLKTQLSEKTDVHTLSFDVRDKKDVFAKIESLPEDFAQVDILVNNAGNAHGLSSIQDGDVDDWDAMIDINVKGLLYVSKAIIAQMTERKSGHIINIGSIAGKDVYPNGNVYNASKFAVNALNEAMRYDLNEFGIRVGAVHPGLVHTEFSEVRFKGDTEKAEGVYQGYTPLYAEDIADVIFFMISRRSSVNIADLVIYPTAQASATIVNKNL